MKLAIILGSTRPGRQTERLAKWIVKTAENHPNTEVDFIDLEDFPMPFFDEAVSPRYNPNRKVDAGVQKWLDRLQAADAYVFVTPEYNHSVPGVLKNALDYVTWELVKKPATIAAHGTVGGARAIIQLKEILSESRAAIIPSQLAVALLAEKIDEQGNITEAQKALPHGPQTQLDNMLTELQWYSDALMMARAKDQA